MAQVASKKKDAYFPHLTLQMRAERADDDQVFEVRATGFDPSDLFGCPAGPKCECGVLCTYLVSAKQRSYENMGLRAQHCARCMSLPVECNILLLMCRLCHCTLQAS